MQEYFLNYFTDDESFPFFIQYGGHDEDLVKHTHNGFSELVIVLSGDALHLVNDEQFHIKKGDVFVIHEHTAHAYRNVHNFRICNIMYPSEFMNFEKMDIAQTAGFHALFFLEPFYTKNSHFESRLYLNSNELHIVSEQIKQMVCEFNASNPGRQTLLQTKFTELIVYLSRYYEKKAECVEEQTPVMLLANSLAYLQQHFRENILVETLANDSNYSLRHFDRLFKELYHTTPRNYIISLRLSYACDLLENTDKKIEEIALDSGFENVNYFYRIFKKRMHMTPLQWRKKETS